MTDFFHSWAFAFIIGCFVGVCFGFLGAAILAVSGRASRMEERMEKDVFRADELPFETPEEIADREKRKIAYLKIREIIAKQNNED